MQTSTLLPYRHTQPGTLIRWMLGLGLLPLAILLLSAQVRPIFVPYFILILVLVSLPLFWSLTVTVTPQTLRFHFGIGLIHQSVPIADIDSFEAVDGLLSWGIHYRPGRGWLYNVSGRQAVALRLKSGKTLRVGSDEPALLCRALAEARAQRP